MISSLHTTGNESSEDSSGIELDPRSLLIFRHMGHSGSVTATAQALGWTQPAVSRHIRKIESLIGVQLIERAGRGMVLTSAGQSLLTHADTVHSALDSANRAMTDLVRLSTGSVRVAAFPSATASFLGPAIKSLTEAYPGIDIHIEELEPPEAIRKLELGQVDVAVVFEYREQPEFPSRFRVLKLVSDEMVAVLSEGHHFAERATVALGDLRNERWIAGCARCREFLVQRAAADGFVPRVHHVTDDYVAVQALVAEGIAVAMLPRMALRVYMHPRVRAVPFGDNLTRGVFAVRRATTVGIPAVTAFEKHLAEAASLPRE